MKKKIRLKKGDTVKVISGKSRGAVGVISKVIYSSSRVVVSGVNLVKKHTKPSQASDGGIVTKELSVHISNVAYYDNSSSSVSKISYSFLDSGEKVRVLKKTNETI